MPAAAPPLASAAEAARPFPHRHLLGIAGLSASEIGAILDEAEQWIEFNRRQRKQDRRLAGLTQINAFFEPSTRTLISFEIAGKRLGADVVNMHAAQSSLVKGESLIDTARTLNAMRPDILVVRHAENGAVARVADAVNCAVINAGDGAIEHPTQALLDALTIRRRFGRIEGLKVVICGDIAHSRVAGSNMRALPMLGAEVIVAAPEALLPALLPPHVSKTTDFDAAITGADVVMMLRIQNERLPTGLEKLLGDYHAAYGLTRERLARAAPHAIVMHPGPMNRGVEIVGELADDRSRSVILEQVELGVAVRMACLDLLTRAQRDAAIPSA